MRKFMVVAAFLLSVCAANAQKNSATLFTSQALAADNVNATSSEFDFPDQCTKITVDLSLDSVNNTPTITLTPTWDTATGTLSGVFARSATTSQVTTTGINTSGANTGLFVEFDVPRRATSFKLLASTNDVSGSTVSAKGWSDQ